MSTWIFQGNPDFFQIADYLAASSGSIKWRVTRYADRIAPGDLVYFWRSIGDGREPGGIVADGVVTEHPRRQLDDPLAEGFYVGEREEEMAMRVLCRVRRIANHRQVLKRD